MSNNFDDDSHVQINFDQKFEWIGGRLSAEMQVRLGHVQEIMDARVGGLEREINAKLDGKPGHGALIGHTVAIISLLGALILGVLSFGSDRFDGGISVSGAIDSQLERQAARDKSQDEKLDLILQKLEQDRR
jgi:hypothetical protein